MLENQLRTWSELKRLKKAEQVRNDPQRRNTLSAFLTKEQQIAESPVIPARRWGGCVGGCDHQNEQYPRRKAQGEVLGDVALPPAARELQRPGDGTSEKDGGSVGGVGGVDGSADVLVLPPPPTGEFKLPLRPVNATRTSAPNSKPTTHVSPHLHNDHGVSTPHEMSDSEEYFETKAPTQPKTLAQAVRRPDRKPTVEDINRWASESGMGRGGHADPLGDEPESEYDGDESADLEVGGGIEVGGGLEWRSSAEVKDAEREADVVGAEVVKKAGGGTMEWRSQAEITDAEREDRSLRGRIGA